MREGRVEANVARISQLLEAADVLRDVALRSINGNGALTEMQNAILLRLPGGAISTDSFALQPSRSARSARTLRVGIEKLDRMLDLAGEIATVRGNVRQLVGESGGDEQMLDAVRELDRLSFDLQEAIMNVRLVPVGPS